VVKQHWAIYHIDKSIFRENCSALYIIADSFDIFQAEAVRSCAYVGATLR
jgi:hypothetical protein